MSKKSVYGIGISGRIGLNAHDLNNEEQKGNKTLARRLTVVDNNYQPATVTAISGQMLKHIHSSYLHDVLTELNANLCAGCQNFSANRITEDEDFLQEINEVEDKTIENKAKIIDSLLERCAIDDIEGNLLTENNMNLKKESVIKFGWSYNLPDKFTIDSKMGVKFSDVEGSSSEDDSGGNQAQNIYENELVSGQTVFNTQFNCHKIGLNSINQTYFLEDEAKLEEIRLRRYQATLKSLISTFLNPEGAKTTTCLPDITSLEGVISYSLSATPPIRWSASEEDYRDKIKKVAKSKEKLDDEVKVKEFDSPEEFADILGELYQNYKPYKK